MTTCPTPDVSASALAERYRPLLAGGGIALIDVRTPAEFRAEHAQGARNLPLAVLDPSLLAGEVAAGRHLHLICQSGTRARQAQTVLLARNIACEVVEGGTSSWVAAGLPVERGASAMGLERQVRIAAGSLVAIGCALAFWLHPWFIALPAFVGTGLVFSGITDTCGMGMLLARCPWNQR